MKLSCFLGRSKYYMYAFAPEKARGLVYGDGSDAGRLSFCEFIFNDGIAKSLYFIRLLRSVIPANAGIQ